MYIISFNSQLKNLLAVIKTLLTFCVYWHLHACLNCHSLNLHACIKSRSEINDFMSFAPLYILVYNCIFLKFISLHTGQDLFQFLFTRG